jgi:glycosyltransferase involved in cell wall biosynthesis
MKVLFLCNKSPWPPREGGPIAMNMFIEGLIGQGHQVKVLAVNSWKYQVSLSDIPLAYQKKTGIELTDVDLRLKPVDALKCLITGRSYHIARFDSKPFKNRVREILQEDDFDVVQLESVFTGPCLPVIRKHSSAKVVLRAHNIEYLIWDRIATETPNPLKRWYLRKLAETLREYEEKLAIQVDGIVPITKADCRYFSDLVSQRSGSKSAVPIPVTAIPFGTPPREESETMVETRAPSLFTLGAMNWIPNQDGVRWFLDQVWPDIHRQFPELHYYLAGRATPEWMMKMAIPQVHVLGEIDDARDFMAQHTIMVVPLFSGSGLRIKIIEGMASGKTIISTTLGAEGIECTPRENILIADTPCEFFEMISLCLSDLSGCKKIGTAARGFIRDHYNPDNLVGRLVSFYQQLPR